MPPKKKTGALTSTPTTGAVFTPRRSARKAKMEKKDDDGVCNADQKLGGSGMGTETGKEEAAAEIQRLKAALMKRQAQEIAKENALLKKELETTRENLRNSTVERDKVIRSMRDQLLELKSVCNSLNQAIKGTGIDGAKNVNELTFKKALERAEMMKGQISALEGELEHVDKDEDLLVRLLPNELPVSDVEQSMVIGGHQLVLLVANILLNVAIYGKRLTNMNKTRESVYGGDIVDILFGADKEFLGLVPKSVAKRFKSSLTYSNGYLDVKTPDGVYSISMSSLLKQTCECEEDEEEADGIQNFLRCIVRSTCPSCALNVKFLNETLRALAFPSVNRISPLKPSESFFSRHENGVLVFKNNLERNLTITGKGCRLVPKKATIRINNEAKFKIPKELAKGLIEISATGRGMKTKEYDYVMNRSTSFME